MRPKPDSYQWYKMQKDTTSKAKEEIAKIREKLGLEGNRYEKQTEESYHHTRSSQ